MMEQDLAFHKYFQSNILHLSDSSNEIPLWYCEYQGNDTWHFQKYWHKALQQQNCWLLDLAMDHSNKTLKKKYLVFVRSNGKDIIEVRDHPFKTSAFFRGKGQKFVKFADTSSMDGPKLYIPSTPNNSNETHTFMYLGRTGRFGQR